MTVMERKQAPKVTITEQLRKGLNSELKVQRLGSEGTKGGTTMHSALASMTGTMRDQRKSIDRQTNQF